MNAFTYTRAEDVATAVGAIAGDGAARFIAGGTNLVDLMKADIERPSRLIDITRLPLRAIEPTSDGGLRIGALVTNTDLAYHSDVGIRCYRAPSWPARRRNCATWPRSGAT